MDFSKISLTQLRKFLYHFVECFHHERLLHFTTCICWDDHVFSVLLMECITLIDFQVLKYLCISKSHLVMVHYSFHVLLVSICKHFWDVLVYIFIKDIGLQFSNDLFVLCECQENISMAGWFGKCCILLCFVEKLVKNWYCTLFKYLVEFTKESIWV